MHVTWNEPDEQSFAAWLEQYANAWLNEIRQFFPKEVGNIDWLLRELRTRLIARIEYWKSEARRYLNQQAEDRNALALMNRGGSLKSDRISSGNAGVPQVPALPRPVATSAEAWGLMQKDFTLRLTLMTRGSVRTAS